MSLHETGFSFQLLRIDVGGHHRVGVPLCQESCRLNSIRRDIEDSVYPGVSGAAARREQDVD